MRLFVCIAICVALLGISLFAAVQAEIATRTLNLWWGTFSMCTFCGGVFGLVATAIGYFSGKLND